MPSGFRCPRLNLCSDQQTLDPLTCATTLSGLAVIPSSGGSHPFQLDIKKNAPPHKPALSRDVDQIEKKYRLGSYFFVKSFWKWGFTPNFQT